MKQIGADPSEHRDSGIILANFLNHRPTHGAGDRFHKTNSQRGQQGIVDAEFSELAVNIVDLVRQQGVERLSGDCGADWSYSVIKERNS